MSSRLFRNTIGGHDGGIRSPARYAGTFSPGTSTMIPSAWRAMKKSMTSANFCCADSGRSFTRSPYPVVSHASAIPLRVWAMPTYLSPVVTKPRVMLRCWTSIRANALGWYPTRSMASSTA